MPTFFYIDFFFTDKVWDRAFFENTHPRTIIYQTEDCNLKITVWLSKTFKVNPTSDYGKLLGGVIADLIIKQGLYVFQKKLIL